MFHFARNDGGVCRARDDGDVCVALGMTVPQIRRDRALVARNSYIVLRDE